MISVIIPIYNGEKELDRMLESILNQTFTDYEVIMVDDGSTDQTAKICEAYETRDRRFHYFYQENKGVSAARNNGLEKAKGDYIAFVDADDMIENNYFEILWKHCQEADIAICDVVVEANGKESRRFTLDDVKLTRREAVNALLQREKINSGPYAKLFRKAILGDTKFPNLATYEDMIFNLDVFMKACVVMVTSSTQYHYITNPEGAMSNMGKAPSEDIIEATGQILQFINENGNITEPECLYVTISHLYQYVLSMVHGECRKNINFIQRTRKLFRKYWLTILKCTRVPTKEKIVFTCFILGWLYTNKNFIDVRG